MIKWTDEEEGLFHSDFFDNPENEYGISVYIESPDLKAYAEKCVASLNSLSESVLRDICRGIILSAAENSNNDFSMPVLENEFDIMRYCWFSALYISVPENENEISYTFEGEGDWGEIVGFVIKNQTLVYVGVDYENL